MGHKCTESPPTSVNALIVDFICYDQSFGTNASAHCITRRYSIVLIICIFNDGMTSPWPIAEDIHEHVCSEVKNDWELVSNINWNPLPEQSNARSLDVLTYCTLESDEIAEKRSCDSISDQQEYVLVLRVTYVGQLARLAKPPWRCRRQCILAPERCTSASCSCISPGAYVQSIGVVSFASSRTKVAVFVSKDEARLMMMIMSRLNGE